MSIKSQELKTRRKPFFSQKEFAAQLGVRPETLSRVEHGHESFRNGTAKLAEAIIVLMENGEGAAKKVLMKVL